MKSQDVVEMAVEDRRRVSGATVPQPEEDPEVENEEEAPGEEADDEEGEVEADEDDGAETDESTDEGDDGDAEESEVAGPSLEKLKEARAVLRKREDAIQAGLAKSEDAERNLTEKIESLKADLIEGGSAEEIPDLVVKLEARRVATAALRDALRKIETPAAKIDAEVQRIETEIERERQWKASAKLRKEAAGCPEDFVRGIATLTAPLLRHQEIAAKYRAQFPLAAAMPALKFEHLVHRLDAALGRPGPVATRFYLLRILNGALSGSQVSFLDPSRARALGIDVE